MFNNNILICFVFTFESKRFQILTANNKLWNLCDNYDTDLNDLHEFILLPVILLQVSMLDSRNLPIHLFECRITCVQFVLAHVERCHALHVARLLETMPVLYPQQCGSRVAYITKYFK